MPPGSPEDSSAVPGGGSGVLLDGRYRIGAPVSEGLLLRELRGEDTHTGATVALWMPHRQVAPALEDIEAEIAASELPDDTTGSLPSGCRRVLGRGRRTAFVVGAAADHGGPKPRRNPHAREVVAGWFRAVAGIIARNHSVGRWHGLLTCDDLSISDGKLVAAGFGFWVRADAEAIATALAAPESAAAREWCAPEVLACAIGPAADLWALGRCTLALATGSGEGDAMAALQLRHPPLARVLGRLLHADPEARPSDLRALSEEVTRALETPYREDAEVAAMLGARAAGSPSSALSSSPVVYVPHERDDTEQAQYEPGTGTWSGAELAALAIPTPAAQTWSPATPRPQLQMISMKQADPPGTAARPVARVEAPRLAPPKIRSLEAVAPSPRASAEALGTIAPPRALTQPVRGPQKKWPMTLLVVLLALLAVGAAAIVVSRL